MAEVNGLLVDLRSMPREVQQIAFDKGMIPYIPADHEKGLGYRPPVAGIAYRRPITDCTELACSMAACPSLAVSSTVVRKTMLAPAPVTVTGFGDRRLFLHLQARHDRRLSALQRAAPSPLSGGVRFPSHSYLPTSWKISTRRLVALNLETRLRPLAAPQVVRLTKAIIVPNDRRYLIATTRAATDLRGGATLDSHCLMWSQRASSSIGLSGISNHSPTCSRFPPNSQAKKSAA